MSTKEFIQKVIDSETAVLIYLRNGVKLSGKILSQDAAAIVVDGKNGTENLVFMHAISTVAIPTGTKADG